MPQPTNINAFRMELQEAQKEESQAHSRVEELKETIATMEQAAGGEDVAAQDADLPPRSDGEPVKEVPKKPVVEKKPKDSKSKK